MIQIIKDSVVSQSLLAAGHCPLLMDAEAGGGTLWPINCQSDSNDIGEYETEQRVQGML